MNKVIAISSAITLCFLAGCTSLEKTTPQNINTEKFTSESWKAIIPENCQNFFDGCNQCSRME